MRRAMSSNSSTSPLRFQDPDKVFQNLLGIHLREQEIPTLFGQSVQFPGAFAARFGADNPDVAIGKTLLGRRFSVRS